MTRLLVCGGRGYHDRERVFAVLDRFQARFGVAVVIHGDQRGADRLARDWARARAIEDLAFPADWEKLGRAAGPIRNAAMLNFGKPDKVVAFAGGEGTANMTRQAHDAGLEVFEIAPRRPDGRIFTFGSSRSGRHAKGAALRARETYGAICGQGEGLQGQSYAIPTTDERLRPLPLAAIAEHVARFLAFASERADLRFELTPIGCSPTGYGPEQIAPLFAKAPDNVELPRVFREALRPGFR